MTTLFNATSNATLPGANNSISDEDEIFYPLTAVIPITVVYGVIFITGVVGNVSTCTVIACNKSMHTATNYYLFSLAISDMLLLISGLPPEMYRIWSPTTYVFGEVCCILQGFAAETSANATVLTITAFTVERYVAICHPFLSHTMSKLSRAIRYIVAIWIVALCLAAPQAIQFGVAYELKNGVQYSRCTVVSNFFQHAFEISTFLFFVGPMTLITVLYVLIAVQLRKSKNMGLAKKGSTRSSVSEAGRARNSSAQKRVVKMLVAVVAAFFICWAPFHAQRLLAVYLTNASQEAQYSTTIMTVYMVLMHVSGVLYFLSTTVNPLLYNIMSNRFREAFKKTFSDLCRRSPPRPPTQTYSVLSRGAANPCHFQRSVSDGADRINNEELNLKSAKSYNFLGCKRVKQQDNATIIDRKSLRARPVAFSESKPTLTTSFEESDDRGAPPDDKFRIFRLFGQQELRRHGSADDVSNTISNSSLQDMDEIDFSSTDLVRYMEEINGDIT